MSTTKAARVVVPRRLTMIVIPHAGRQPAPLPGLPAVLLTRWRLVERTDPARGLVRRLVGRTDESPGSVRMSSPVVTWDWQLECAVTEGGRMYFLSPKVDPDEADREFMVVAALVTSAEGCDDVTERVIASDGVWRSHDA